MRPLAGSCASAANRPTRVALRVPDQRRWKFLSSPRWSTVVKSWFMNSDAGPSSLHRWARVPSKASLRGRVTAVRTLGHSSESQIAILPS